MSEIRDQSGIRSSIITSLQRSVAARLPITELMQELVNSMHSRLAGYDWAGFYMLDTADPSMLGLGPFAGAATPHTRIPVTEGICGAAVAQGETVVVDDVSADPRYLSCSIKTKSEIVVPIRANRVIVGEIDIDSHTAAFFGGEDRAFVEQCAEIIGSYFETAGVSK